MCCNESPNSNETLYRINGGIKDLEALRHPDELMVLICRENIFHVAHDIQQDALMDSLNLEKLILDC